MSELLRPLLLIEGGIVAALFLLLLVWPVVVRVMEARRRRQHEALLAAVRGVGGDREGPRDDPGEDGAGDVRSALESVRQKALLRALESMEEDGTDSGRPDLGRLLRDTRAFERVEEAARSRLWWRRQTAAQVLARVARPPDDRPLLVSLIRDPHPAVSTAGLLAARELGWPSLAEPLLELALGPRAGNRAEAALLEDTLADLDADLASVLLDRLESAAGQPEELALMRIAGRIEGERLRTHLADRLRHGGLEVRVQAVRSLARSGPDGAADELRRALNDPAWQVRTQAARGLEHLGAVGAAGDLQRALSDPSWWVRLRAALALCRLGPDGRRILESVDPEDDRYAADMADYVLGLDEEALREYAR